MSKLSDGKEIEKLACGSLWEVRALLAQGVDVNAYIAGDRCEILLPRALSQETVLHRAVWEKRIDNVSFLLRAGANTNARSSAGNTPLHCAVMVGCVDIVWLLVACGAEIDAQNDQGDTPLHMSVRFSTIVKALLQAGANRALTDRNGWTPLDVAKYRSRIDAVNLLE